MFSLVRRFLAFLARIAEALERIAASLESQATSAVAALPPEALSKQDAARFLGADVATVENLIRTRKVEYVQHGAQRGRLLPVESLRKFLRKHRRETGDVLLAKRKRAQCGCKNVAQDVV